ncbi:hypothetical protein B9Z55_027185 [Caenorhabditis nigoni]|uniref:Uncharacterized protein n=1 Tax=Caenorhabditis nigoni TaxID=1611254 RepID=A0A2G5SH14_9PELO|nr:hypothetical protein B9Z55_027185 [Caenorhabditis nigoni]
MFFYFAGTILRMQPQRHYAQRRQAQAQQAQRHQDHPQDAQDHQDQQPLLPTYRATWAARKKHIAILGGLRKNKEMSTGAILDKVLEGYRAGPYEKEKVPDIAKAIGVRFGQRIEEERRGIEESYFLGSLEPILTGELNVNPEDLRELEEMRKARTRILLIFGASGTPNLLDIIF